MLSFSSVLPGPSWSGYATWAPRHVWHVNQAVVSILLAGWSSKVSCNARNSCLCWLVLPPFAFARIANFYIHVHISRAALTIPCQLCWADIQLHSFSYCFTRSNRGFVRTRSSRTCLMHGADVYAVVATSLARRWLGPGAHHGHVPSLAQCASRDASPSGRCAQLRPPTQHGGPWL